MIKNLLICAASLVLPFSLQAQLLSDDFEAYENDEKLSDAWRGDSTGLMSDYLSLSGGVGGTQAAHYSTDWSEAGYLTV